jgi:PST family polysaccharide transporter
MALLILSFERFARNWEIYFTAFGVVIGQVLFPVWLFQGLERMKYVTYLNIGAKAFFTVCIFVFVKEQADYLLVPLLTAVGSILAGISSLYLVSREINVNFVWQTTSTLKFQLAEGWHVFFSSMAISLYTVSTIVVLGLFTNNAIVGYFAAADKIVQAVKGLYNPISQAIFPLIGKKIHEDRQEGLSFIYKITWVAASGMFVISTILFLLAESIVNLFLGEQYEQSVLLLEIMAFLPFVIALSNIFGIQMMLNLGYKKEFGYFVLITAISGVGLSLALTSLFKAVGLAVAVLSVEILVTAMLSTFIILKVKKGGL